MPEKRRLSDSEKSRIAEKISDFILLMGYNADFQVVIAKELNRQLWMSSENLCRKQCRELLYLLYVADTATLLSFTVSLGRAIWEHHLRAKRRIYERKLLEKMKQRERGRQKKLGGKPRLVVMVGRGVKSGASKQEKGNVGCLWVRLGFRLRPVYGFRVLRHRSAKHDQAEFGSRMYRLALAMRFLSFRNICVTSEWEFWAVYLVKQVFGFWRSIAIGGELNGSFTCIANTLGFDVVSCEVLERLQSCLRCSSTTRYPGPPGPGRL